MKYVKAIYALCVSFFKKWFYQLKLTIVRKLLAFRAKLQIASLREAIASADKDKERTGRKNMVVFNTVSGKYEPVQKKLLKTASNVTKNKSNKAQTPGRLRMMKRRKERVLNAQKVHQIEKKSLYVTG